MVRALGAIVFAFVLILAPAVSADAQGDDGGFVGSTDGEAYDATVTSYAIRVSSPFANPSVDAARDDVRNPGLSNTRLTGWPAPHTSRCARTQPARFNVAGVYFRAKCLTAWVCGGERIDDVVSGRIAGPQTRGRYGDFLDEMVGFFGAEVAALSGVGDATSVNDYLIAQGLGDARADDQLPVLYWCGHQDRLGGPVEIQVTPSNPSRAPRLAWDTDVPSEYNVPGLRADVLAELEAEIGLYTPQLASVPPIDGNFTWVKWPTWFWVESSLVPIVAFDENTENTFRLEMRAIVDRVEWTYDGVPFLICSPSQMVAYNERADDPVADAPDCSHRFLTAANADLEATVYFKVEDREMVRLTDGDAYPDVAWSPHPDDPEIELSTTIPDYGVRELFSVNTPINMTDDEIAELLRTTE